MTEPEHVESIRVGAVLAYTDTASGGIRIEVDRTNADGGVERHRLLITEEGIIYDLYADADADRDGDEVTVMYHNHFND